MAAAAPAETVTICHARGQAILASGCLTNGVADADRDVVIDGLDADDDNAGMPDTFDLDDNGAGIPDVTNPDTDGDGAPWTTDQHLPPVLPLRLAIPSGDRGPDVPWAPGRLMTDAGESVSVQANFRAVARRARVLRSCRVVQRDGNVILRVPVGEPVDVIVRMQSPAIGDRSGMDASVVYRLRSSSR